jgi:DNA-binding transcriptional MerR regulator
LAAWAALGIPVNQVKEVIALAKKLQTEKEEALLVIKKLGQDKARLENRIAQLVGPGVHVVKLPAQLRGSVLVADPKWDFVVLDVGEDQGVLEDGELLVNRNGKLVAKVIVRTVQKGRCIANVMPGWKLGDVTEGDQVIPAHPAS